TLSKALQASRPHQVDTSCLALLLLLLRSGTGEPTAQIDGHQRSLATIRENATQQFHCHSEGGLSVAPPQLTWYLNGQRQLSESNQTNRLVMTSLQDLGLFNWTSSQSTFTLQARKGDQELNCTAVDPTSGDMHTASVVLNIEFLPEVVQMNASYSDTDEAGLSLILFALIRSNPPATITWLDDTGQLVANTTDFLILDSKNYPWLTNHTLHVTLSSLPSNISVSAKNQLGITNSSIALADFLRSRVEVPVLAIFIGGSLGFLSLVLLNLLLFCIVSKRRRRVADKNVEPPLPKSGSSRFEFDNVLLPRENMSLPSNLQLNDLSGLCKGVAPDVVAPVAEDESEHSDRSKTLTTRGFVRLPMVGYIYKVSSMSSDEIWL
ncbi:transmembrane protein 25, partial [Erpetoichthys calabaricus]|uniref:transmembrane protein 25 n=1 Tax=Erpetoichthys calabaricus TaxID=27687 RepID=UPI002233E4C3